MNQPASATAVRGVLALLVGVGLVYLIVLPSVSIAWDWFVATARPTRFQRLPDETPWSEWLFLKSLEVVMASIFFAIGASVGSFLNVVVYRWPLRKPLFWQRSHCPNCGSGIRAKDNLPLVGWLRLGGSCRDCHSPISSRYPWIEGLMGTIFLWLFAIELISGGWNLANREPNVYTGVVWILFYTKWDLVGYYLYHCLLFSLLMVTTLIEFDRRYLTKGQVLVGCIWLVLPPLLWPSLLLWKVDLFGVPLGNTMATLAVGGFWGATLGYCFRPLGLAWVSGLWLGIALGWQAVLGVFCIAWLMRILTTVGRQIFGSWLQASPSMVITEPRLDPSDATEDPHSENDSRVSVERTRTLGSLWILLAGIAHHGMWRWLTLTLSPYWPGAAVTIGLLLVWLGLVAVVWIVDRALRGQAWLQLDDPRVDLEAN